jgi:hypothetical protein
MNVQPMSETKTIRCLVHFDDDTSEVLDVQHTIPALGAVMIGSRPDPPVWNVRRRDRIEPKDDETGAQFELWVSPGTRRRGTA